MSFRLFNRLARTSRNLSSLSPSIAAQRPSALTLASIFAAGSATTYLIGKLDVFANDARIPKTPVQPPSLSPIQLENSLHSLPILQEMRQAPDSDDWYEARPTISFPESRRVHHMTAGALRGPGLVAVPPLARVKKDESEAVVFIHLGRDLCAHDGIVHGGMLATVLDEMLARVAIKNLPDKVGVTASLTVNYRAPTKADQWVLVKANLTSAQGRKTTVSGRIEDLEGTVLAEASALFVQPKYAPDLLDRTTLEQAMGTPIPAGQYIQLNSSSKDGVWRDGAFA